MLFRSSLSGDDAGNYVLDSVATTTANITHKPLTVSGITANSKPWDGNTSATLNLGSAALVGVLSGETVNLDTSGASGAFSSNAVGTWSVQIAGLTISGPDSANYSLTQPTTTASITAWNAQGHGFYAPVGVPNSYFVAAPGQPPTAHCTTTMWNTVKGGSTVPLKFNVFAGTVEKTSTSDIQSFTVAKLPTCSSDPYEDPVDVTTTGGTSLRYDTIEHQFIQNWKTDKVNQDSYYRATVRFMDGSTISAFFKLRK